MLASGQAIGVALDAALCPGRETDPPEAGEFSANTAQGRARGASQFQDVHGRGIRGDQAGKAGIWVENQRAAMRAGEVHGVAARTRNLRDAAIAADHLAVIGERATVHQHADLTGYAIIDIAAAGAAADHAVIGNVGAGIHVQPDAGAAATAVIAGTLAGVTASTPDDVAEVHQAAIINLEAQAAGPGGTAGAGQIAAGAAGDGPGIGGGAGGANNDASAATAATHTISPAIAARDQATIGEDKRAGESIDLEAIATLRAALGRARTKNESFASACNGTFIVNNFGVA